jgi:hypothetical protein
LFSERRFILHASVAHGERAAALGEERSGGRVATGQIRFWAAEKIFEENFITSSQIH